MAKVEPNRVCPADPTLIPVLDEFCDELKSRLTSRKSGRLLLWLLRHRAVAEPILRRVFLLYCDQLVGNHNIDPRARNALELYRRFVEGEGGPETLTLTRKQARIAARALRSRNADSGAISRRLAIRVRDASRNDAGESWYKTIGGGWNAKDADAFVQLVREYFADPAHLQLFQPIANRLPLD